MINQKLFTINKLISLFFTVSIKKNPMKLLKKLKKYTKYEINMKI